MADDKKKKATGQFTHWGRPNWLRMYEYNYEYGEAYYRPQVRYISTSKVSSELSSSSYSSKSSYYASTSSADVQREYTRRRRAVAPPKAMSFIERWAQEPFYGYRVGFLSRNQSGSSQLDQQLSSYQQSSVSARRSRRAQSEVSSNYASQSLLKQISSARSSSKAVQEESGSVYDSYLRQRRARSVDARMSVERDQQQGYFASDDCLMRSTAMDKRSVRAASVDIASRYSREGSLTKQTLAVDQNNVLRGETLDKLQNYDYPRQHLVCTEKCPMYNNPDFHRKFVIGNRFADAAALGGFDVLYDPTVYKKTRALLQRFSQERSLEETIFESSRETESQSRSIYAYNTRY